MEVALLCIGILYFVSKSFAHIFQRYKIPDVLLLMAIGIILGPVFHTVSADTFGKVGRVITTIALAVILFEGGISMKLDQVVKGASSTLRLSLISAAATLFLVGCAAFSLSYYLLPHLSISEAGLLGAIVCGTSSAVVIPMVKALRTSEFTENLLVLESAVTDVLCIILTFAFLNIVLNPHDIQIGKILGNTVASFGLAALIGIAGGYLWLKLCSLLPEMRSTIFPTISVVLIFYGCSESLGFSGAIAVLAFGLFLNNREVFPTIKSLRIPESLPELQPYERSLYSELVFLLKTFFFIFLGAVMPFTSWQPHLAALIFCALIYMARVLIVRHTIDASVPKRERMAMIFLIPKGLAAAVLAGIPSQMGIHNGALIEELVYALVFQTILISSIGIGISEAFCAKNQTQN